TAGGHGDARNRRPRTGGRDGKRPRPASCSATSRLPATIRLPVTTLPESVTGSGTPASRHRSETTTARGAAERWLGRRTVALGPLSRLRTVRPPPGLRRCTLSRPHTSHHDGVPR